MQVSVDFVEALPILVQSFGRIQRLKLDYCAIGDDEFCSLGQVSDELCPLALLDLEGNSITHAGLAGWLKTWKHLNTLTKLDLRGNPIGDEGAAQLAAASHDLSSLEYLEVPCCEISNIGFEAILSAVVEPPWSDCLKGIYIRHNPLSDIPPEIADGMDIRHWYGYAISRADRRRTINYAMILIVGQGGVGKSHLRMRLFEKDTNYYEPKGESTCDFEVSSWTAPMHVRYRSERLAVRVLDFGGQRELHSTHRLFLSGRRSVFVIVCDATRSRQENRLDYWLRFIKNEASARSPMFVVVTKCDLYDEETDERVERKLEALDIDELRRSSGLPEDTILEVHEDVGWSQRAESTWDDERNTCHWVAIETLEGRITEAMYAVPGLRTHYPTEFGQALTWLETEGLAASSGERVAYIAVDDVVSKCLDIGVVAEDVGDVLRIAHSIGLVHWAGMLADLRRGDGLIDVLFNPEWVRTPIYRIIRDGRSSRRPGVVTWSQILKLVPDHDGDPLAESLWERLSFSAPDRVKVVDLMVACGLMFKIRGRQGGENYLVPDHLAVRAAAVAPRGDYVWQRSFDWLSEGAFGALVGRLHQQAVADPAAVWRDEITFSVGPDVDATVRLVIGTEVNACAFAGSGARVFVAISGGAEEEATRIVSLIDAELRGIVGEPLVGPSEWTRLGCEPKPCDVEEANSAISRDAEILLVTLARIWHENRGTPRHAWVTKRIWLEAADFNRRRKDAEALFDELLRRGFVETRSQGKAGRWRVYVVTPAGRQLAEQLRKS